MNRFYLLIAVLIGNLTSLAGDPAIPGDHPLTQGQAGSVLIAQLRCFACHTGIQQSSELEKKAPELAAVGARVSPEYLRRFLASPLQAHPGTTMPDVLASRSDVERQAIAEALTHFLVSQTTREVAIKSSEPVDLTLGKALYHSIGCVACHGPRELASEMQSSSNAADDDEGADADDGVTDDGITDSGDGDSGDSERGNAAKDSKKKVKPMEVSLGHVASKYSVESLSEYLFHPLQVRSSGLMPDMKLTASESRAIAGYLVGDQAVSFTPLVPDGALVEAGRKYFQSLNCAACHAIPGMQAAEAVGPLKGADLGGGCLSIGAEKKEGDKSLRFDLDTDQLAAIRAAIEENSKADPVLDSEEVALSKSLTAFRCIACHVRDGFGGVHESHSPFFKGSELNLGDDGRIPPPLTLVGAKLQANWMKKVLYDGESVRHYMETRMPQYGAANLAHLPGLFRRLDVLAGPEMKIPSPESRNETEREREKVLRAAGRELLGDKGANCVACHRFNSKGANVNQGIELLTSYERLEPAWFYHYLRNPGAFRPRTVMPSAWPDGVSAFTNILDGNSDEQIASIWYYLSLGTSAADPSGVRSVSTRLEVGEQALLHRGRSRVAGYRGIAVGLPQKISYAFNAETGTLSAIWQGNFVGVNWSGQGSGDFNPASEPITLAQDVSFATLADDQAAWPLLPVMTKEAPANPDPLYPKNVGYQFRGYYLGEDSIPTFQYRSGDVDIEDRCQADGDAEQRGLKRVLQFEADSPQRLWFRVLVGEVVRESDNVYRSGRLRVTIPGLEANLRSLSDEPPKSELLLRLEIPQGKTTLEFLYEPLAK